MFSFCVRARYHESMTSLNEHKNIPPCFYRVSAKALILDESKQKFLVVQEADGRWELPGGGIDHGETPTEALRREIKEEMGLEIRSVAEHPAYFFTFLNVTGFWLGNALYETTLLGLDFTPSDECIAIKFVTREEALTLNAFSNVFQFSRLFEPKRHI